MINNIDRKQGTIDEKKKKKLMSKIERMLYYLILFGILYSSGFIITRIYINNLDRKATAKESTGMVQAELATAKGENKADMKEEIKKIGQNNSNLILVNKNYSIDSSYKSQDLVIPKVNCLKSSSDENRKMTKEASQALEDMFSDAKKENIKLMLVSAYRSYESQEKVYKDKIKNAGTEEANKYVAKPGTSEHQTGLAVDVNSVPFTELAEDFEKTKEGKWIKENCSEYGFIIRYPKGKEEKTGYSYEPWHLRYVGKETAKAIMSNNLTLEEYLESLVKNKG